MAILLAEKERQLRLLTELHDTDVDLSMIGLPEAALMFAAISVSATPMASPELLGTIIPAPALLDAGVPIHILAQRMGDDPAVLQRTCTKRRRSRQADQPLTSTITDLAASFLLDEPSEKIGYKDGRNPRSTALTFRLSY